MTSLILAMLLAGRPCCIPVPAGTDWQLYIDADGVKSTGYDGGFDLIVRGIEIMDGNTVPVRFAQGGVGDCVNGGWGAVAGTASVVAGKAVMMLPAASKVTIETYTAGTRVATAAVGISTTCPNRGLLGDFDNDGKVGLSDYAVFQRAMTP